METTAESFPECANNCSIIEVLGAGECESVCLKKFKGLPNPKDVNPYDAKSARKIHKHFKKSK